MNTQDFGLASPELLSTASTDLAESEYIDSSLEESKTNHV